MSVLCGGLSSRWRGPPALGVDPPAPLGSHFTLSASWTAEISENNPSNLFPLFAERTWHNIFIGVCLESCLDWRQNAEWNLPKWKKRLKPKLQHFRGVKCCLVDADETFCIVSLPQEIFNTWPDLRTQEINEPDCPAMTLAPGFHLTKINFTSGDQGKSPKHLQIHL